MRANGGVAGVGEGAGLAVAEAGDLVGMLVGNVEGKGGEVYIVFIAAEGLVFSGSAGRGRVSLDV